MVTLKEEEAFAFALKTEFLDSGCSFCFADESQLFKCKACHVVSYCDRKCQKDDWENHKNECRLLGQWKKSHSVVPDEHVRVTSRILLKSAEALAQKAFNGRTWESLVDHVADWKNSPVSQEKSNFLRVARDLIEFTKPLKVLSLEEAEKAVSKVETNAFEGSEKQTGLKPIGTCIFLGLSVHNHSCLPDCMWSSKGKKLTIRALKQGVAYSSNLTVSYVTRCPFTDFHVLRHIKFKELHFFNCSCALCTDKNHIINRMAESCYVSCCKDGVGIFDENSKEPYRCNKCGKASAITQGQVLTSQIVLDVLNKSNLRISEMGRMDMVSTDFIKECRQVLQQHKKVLSMYNYRIIDLCNQIITWTRETNTDLAIEIEESVLPAIEYYLPAGIIDRTVQIMSHALMKFRKDSNNKNLGLMKRADLGRSEKLWHGRRLKLLRRRVYRSRSTGRRYNQRASTVKKIFRSISYTTMYPFASVPQYPSSLYPPPSTLFGPHVSATPTPLYVQPQIYVLNRQECPRIAPVEPAVTSMASPMHSCNQLALNPKADKKTQAQIKRSNIEMKKLLKKTKALSDENKSLKTRQTEAEREKGVMSSEITRLNKRIGELLAEKIDNLIKIRRLENKLNGNKSGNKDYC